MFGKNDLKPVSEYHHDGERRKERNPMNIKSVIAVLTAAALLGVSVTSCLAFRPDAEPDAASPAGVTQPMEEEPSNEPTDNDENAPETPDDTPEEDAAAAEDTGGEDNDLSETGARQGTNSGNQNTVTPAAPTAKDSGAVQIADQQTGNDSQSQDSGSGDSQDGGQQDHNTDQGGDHNDGGSGGSDGGDQTDKPDQDPVQAADVAALTNKARQDNGLGELAAGTEQAAADTRARELVQNFSHTRPDGTACFTAVTGSYEYMGENIAYIQGSATAQDFLDLWMASEGHRANILSDRYVSMSVGVYYDAASNTTYAVQIFFGKAMGGTEPTYTYTETVVAPTCTEQGYTLHTCNEDESKSFKDNYTEALGHDFVDGSCTRCGEADPDYNPEPTYTYTETVVAPTCTEQGYTLHTCNEDESKSFKDNYTEALGHDFVDGSCTRCGEADPDYNPEPTYTYTVTVVPPTCTEQGYTLHTCNEDESKSFKDNYTEALGHDFVDGSCTRCGEADPDYNPEPTYTYTETVVAPTCTEQGYTLHTCNEDESKSFKDNYTEALGHDFVDGSCTRCGEADPDYNPEPTYTYTVTVVPPTCTEVGYTLHTCNEDPSKSYKTDFTDVLDHNYVDGYCTMCGAKDNSYHPSYGDNYDREYYNNTIANLTNQARTDRGQSALRYASEYQAAADTRAQELISSFSHTRPDGSAPETALDALGAQYDAFGENIAYVSAMYKPSRIVENWINSPGHFTNMMNGSYDSFVVGTACDGTYVYAVQIFFSQADTAPADLQTMSETPAEETAPEETASLEEAPAAEETPAPAETPDTDITGTPAEDVTAEPELPAGEDIDHGSGLEETPAEQPAEDAQEGDASGEEAAEPAPEPQPSPEPETPDATPAPSEDVTEAPAAEEAAPEASGTPDQAFVDEGNAGEEAAPEAASEAARPETDNQPE